MNSRLLCACVTGISLTLLSTATLSNPWPDRLNRDAQHTSLVGTKLFTDAETHSGGSILVGADGAIVRIDPEGTLTQSQVPVDLLLTAVDFVSVNVGWAVGHDGVVLHTEDGGKTWQKQLDGEGIGRIMLAWSQTRIASLTAATAENSDDANLAAQLDDALFKLDDIKANVEFGPSLPLMNVWFRNQSTGIVVGAFGTALITKDGGDTWHPTLGAENPNSFHLNAVIGLPDGTLLIAGENGLLFRSTDDGQTWARDELDQNAIYNFVAMPNGDILALGFGGSLHFSSDSGQNWTALNSGTKATLFDGTSLSDGGVLLAQRGGLLYSHDLKNFRLWRSRGRAIWMDVIETQSGKLTLTGQAGVKNLTLDSLKRSLK